MAAPDVEITGTGTILISSEEGETCELHHKTLHELNVNDGVTLSCDDFLQQYNIRLIIKHSTDLPKDVEFEFMGDVSNVKATAKAEEPVVKSDDEEPCIVSDSNDHILPDIVSSHEADDSDNVTAGDKKEATAVTQKRSAPSTDLSMEADGEPVAKKANPTTVVL